jgi:hypothetical protein
MRLKGADDCLPRSFESPHAFAQCAVLSFASGVRSLLFGVVDSHWEYVGHTRTKGLVFSLECVYASFERGELCLALVAAVLGRDAIAVGAGLLALLRCYV